MKSESVLFLFVVILSAYGSQEIAPTFEAFRDTRFLVFTRLNPTIAQIVNINDMTTVVNSNYEASRPTRVIIHGQLSDAESDLNIVLTAAYLATADLNVIVVDWGLLAFRVICEVLINFSCLFRCWRSNCNIKASEIQKFVYKFKNCRLTTYLQGIK